MKFTSIILASSVSALAPVKHNDINGIPGQYIVVMKPGSNFRSMVSKYQDKLKDTYEINSFNAWSGRFTEQDIQDIRNEGSVLYLEQDSKTKINAVQTDAPWGLARVSQRERISGTPKYVYDNTTAGAGVHAYVVDTGINIAHVDFEGRARWGFTAIAGEKEVDDQGHGSHVAGTIGGKTYGVAKKATLVAVKVLNSKGEGEWSDLIKGIEYVVNDHKKRIEDAKAAGKDPSTVRSVGNMSLGGDKVEAANDAVNAAYDSGVLFVVAAGNSNDDSCKYSPASAVKAVTVGATDRNDNRSSFSSYGNCTDIFAPGSGIKSVWIGSETATNTISGTSMASPHVAGVAAVYLGNEFLTPEGVTQKLITSATKDKVARPGAGSPNLLAYTNPPTQ